MSREPEELFLFDLPLGPPPVVRSRRTTRSEAPTRRSSCRSARPESLPLGEAELDPVRRESRRAARTRLWAMLVAAARGPILVPRAGIAKSRRSRPRASR